MSHVIASIHVFILIQKEAKMNPGVLMVRAKAGEMHLICLRYGM